ncbi:hypothetical protein ACFVHW_17150 [Streptomyces sp. NPDC127110]|uniref:hypothetical protein n=1 Tax=Streptomyces sp. NPDC127110 TaxID=3345362 RepID=UPI00363AF1D3
MPPPRTRPRIRILDTVLRNLLAYGVLTCALLAMTGGWDPQRHDARPVPAVYDADISEIVGTWRCVDGTEVVFRADGSAEVTLLDGQDRDYAAGWRLSGPGSWRLTGRQPAGRMLGQHLRLRLPAPTATAARAGAGPPKRAPERYAWTFELRRDERGALELYFGFFPGTGPARGAYVLEKDA